MKKKILIFIAVAVCAIGAVVGIADKNALAVSTQCDQGKITSDKCAEKIKKDEGYDSLKSVCNVDSNGCLAQIKKYLSCVGGTDATACSNWKTSFAKKVKVRIDGASSDDDSDSDDSKKDSDSKTDSDSSSDGGEYADAPPTEIEQVDEGACTSLLPNSWCSSKDGSGIQEIVSLVIAVLTGGVIVAGTIGIIYCGVMWMTARDNENQVATAKRRMMEIVIGIIAWVLIYALANLFIPKSSSDIESGKIEFESGTTTVIRTIAMEDEE